MRWRRTTTGRALDDVRRSGRRVVPRCWYVADFIDANPQYRELLGRGT